MTLEDFKDVYKDAPLLTKLNLLMEVQSRRADAQAIAATERWNENAEAEQYWVNEHRSASAKAMWLSEELKKALKAQEPRVMTLEEVVALPEGGGDVWIESTSMPGIPPWIIAATLTEKTDWQELGALWFSDDQCHYVTDYNLNTADGWRCWTSRPTDEQREAIPWE